MKKIYLLAVSLTISISSFSQSANWAWAHKATGSGSESGSGIVADKAGNVYVTGSFTSDTLTFGTIQLINAGGGGSDIFIAKYSSSGSVIWAKRIGGTLNEGANGIAIDGSANVYITGYFVSASISFGSITLTNTDPDDIFIAKYDSSGNALWAKKAGSLGAGTGNVNSNGIATDAGGHVFITGFFSNHVITFGTININNIDTPQYDIFVAKYDAVSGNPVWAKSTGGTGNDYGYSVATDAAGSVYVVGSFNSPTIVFDTTTLTSHGNYDVFFGKYDASGNPQWARNPGGTGNEEGASVATDTSGNIYITGYFGSALINFGGGNLGNGGLVNIFVASYTSSGNGGWAERFGGTGYDYGASITTDATGNLLLAGYTASPTILLGSTLLTNAVSGGGSYDIYVTRLQALTGSPLWAKGAGGTDYDQATSVTADAAGNTYVTGSFKSATCLFGSISLTWSGAAATYDLFVAKLSAPTDVNEIETENGLTVYPNPATNSIYLTFDNIEINDQSFVSLYSALGEKLMERKIEAANKQFVIDSGNLKNGIYFITVFTGNQYLTKKIAIIK